MLLSKDDESPSQNRLYESCSHWRGFWTCDVYPWGVSWTPSRSWYQLQEIFSLYWRYVQISVSSIACPRLASIEFGVDCLRSIRHVDMCCWSSYFLWSIVLKRLKNISFVPNLFEDAESLSITGKFSCSLWYEDNSKLTELVIPSGCFPHMKYFALQGISWIVSFIDRYSWTGYSWYRFWCDDWWRILCDEKSVSVSILTLDLYPTTISVSQNSILCTASSYKSIPKKLQRICVKNLSKFQKRIASDAFLGQALVGSISVLGLAAIIIVGLI